MLLLCFTVCWSKNSGQLVMRNVISQGRSTNSIREPINNGVPLSSSPRPTEKSLTMSANTSDPKLDIKFGIELIETHSIFLLECDIVKDFESSVSSLRGLLNGQLF